MDELSSKKPMIKFNESDKYPVTSASLANPSNVEENQRTDSVLPAKVDSARKTSALANSERNVALAESEFEEEETSEEEESEEGEDEEGDSHEEEEEEVRLLEEEIPQTTEPSEAELIYKSGLEQCQIVVGKAKQRHDLVDEYLRLKSELKYEEKKNAYLQDRIYKTSVRKGIIDEAKLKKEEAKSRRKTDNIRLIIRRKMLAIKALKREQRRQLRKMEDYRSDRFNRKSRKSRYSKARGQSKHGKSKQSFGETDGDRDHRKSRKSHADSDGDNKHCKHKQDSQERHRSSHVPRKSGHESGHSAEHKKSHSHKHHRHHHKEKVPTDETKDEKEQNVQTLSISKNVPKSIKVKHLQRLQRTKSPGTSALTEQEAKSQMFDFKKANPAFVIRGRGRLYDRINNEFKYDWLIRQVIIHLRKERKYAFYHENNLKRQACKRDLWKKAHEQKLQEIVQVLRTYSEEAVDSNTGQRIPRSNTEQFCKDIVTVHGKLCDTMVSMFKSRRGLELSLKRLEASEIQGEGLQMMEYEQLRSENQTLKDRLSDRVKDVENIKDKITHAIQVLAHFRNKMFSMNQLIAEGKDELDKVNEEVYAARGRTELMVRRHERVKRDEQSLVVESGLLDNATLLRDYERTHFQVQDLKTEKKKLTAELESYTKEISDIKKRIHELQTNYPEIFAKQQAIIAAKRAEKKRQLMAKFNKALESC